MLSLGSDPSILSTLAFLEPTVNHHGLRIQVGQVFQQGRGRFGPKLIRERTHDPAILPKVVDPCSNVDFISYSTASTITTDMTSKEAQFLNRKVVDSWSSGLFPSFGSQRLLWIFGMGPFDRLRCPLLNCSHWPIRTYPPTVSRNR